MCVRLRSEKMVRQREKTFGGSACGRYVVAAGLFAAIVVTGFCDVGVFTDSESNSKWYGFALAVAAGGFATLFFRSSALSGRFRGPALWLLPWFLYGAVRAATGPFMLSFAVSCVLFALLCLEVGALVRRQPFAVLAVPVTATAALLALHGIGQWTGWLPPGDRFVVAGNFDNPAGYASMLALSVPFVLYLTVSDRRAFRCAAWGVWVLVAAAVVLSASRAGTVTFVAVTAAYVAKRYGGRWRNVALWKKIVAAGLAAALAAGLYFAKRDSADGRLLIWKCTAEMIGDKPWFGHGYRSFEAEYMRYQARFFERTPDSRFAPLADNVKHPFNEFLRLAAEFGMAGVLWLGLFVRSAVRAYRRRPDGEAFVFVSVLAGIVVFSCFSYPFSYPFTWFAAAVGTVGLSVGDGASESARRGRGGRRFVVAALSLALAGFTVCGMSFDARWHELACRGVPGGAETVFPEYERLYPFLKKDPYFVYNYAARANRAGDFGRSATLAAECETMLDDYDVEMLQADNFRRMGDFGRAEERYRLASAMCPGRFMPLYELVNLYDATGRRDEADALARVIVLKPAKIPSGTVGAIKMKMEKRLAGE